MGVRINGGLFMLWVILGAVIGFEYMWAAMLISGTFTLVSAIQEI